MTVLDCVLWCLPESNLEIFCSFFSSNDTSFSRRNNIVPKFTPLWYHILSIGSCWSLHWKWAMRLPSRTRKSITQGQMCARRKSQWMVTAIILRFVGYASYAETLTEGRTRASKIQLMVCKESLSWWKFLSCQKIREKFLQISRAVQNSSHSSGLFEIPWRNLRS